MLAYAVRRLAASVVVLLAATVLTFMMVESSGDPIAELRLSQPNMSEQLLEQARTSLYLDRSSPARYWLWLTGLGETNGDIGLLQGHWGPSVRDIGIGAEVRQRFLVTLRLVGAGTLLAILLGFVTGVIGAVRQYSALDHGLNVVGLVALAMPVFWLAALLKATGVWANEQVGRRVVSTIGATSPGHEALPFSDRMADLASHLVLPVLAIALTTYIIISRYLRASLLEALQSDHVLLARAKGLSRHAVLWRHGVRTALLPVTTLIALTVSAVLTGSIVVESVFRWRGLGTFLLESVGSTDTFAVMAFLVVAGAIVVVANLVADLLYGVLDPRIRRA